MFSALSRTRLSICRAPSWPPAGAHRARYSLASEGTTTARTTVTSTTSTAGGNPVEIDSAVLLADSSSDQGVNWLLIALVLLVMTALGTGILRKSRAPRTV